MSNFNLLEYREGRNGPDPVDGKEEESGCRFANEVNVQVRGKRGGGRQPEVDHRIRNYISFDLNDFLFRLGIVSVFRSDRPGQLIHRSRDQRLFAGNL